MALVVLVLALVAYAYVLITYPEIRRWVAAGGALAAVGVALWYWLTPSESARAATRIPPGDLVLDQVVLKPTLRGTTLTGRVRNPSPDFRLREMTLGLRLYDCPAEDAPLADCPVIGEATAIARPDVPPGQLRGFSAQFLFANLPDVVGTLRWDWQAVATRATE